jgi:hypothetical protein
VALGHKVDLMMGLMEQSGIRLCSYGGYEVRQFWLDGMYGLTFEALTVIAYRKEVP